MIVLRAHRPAQQNLIDLYHMVREHEWLGDIALGGRDAMGGMAPRHGIDRGVQRPPGVYHRAGESAIGES